MSKVILVASGKGGTGKTMFSVNLGCILSSLGKNVVIIDLDMGMRNLDMYLGLEGKVVYDTYDALKGVCRTRQALIKDDKFKNLSIIAASPINDLKSIPKESATILFKELKQRFDYVIIDGPPGVGSNLELVAGYADAGIVVLTPDYAAIRDADSVEAFLRKNRVKDRYYVINKAVLQLEKRGLEVRFDEIDSMIKAKPLGAIAYDENIHISTNMGVPIVSKKNAYITKNFLKIANRIIED
ncbi:MAG TPA: septum site-determining protein MinD [Anaerovoracaceae bacterium]|nr:septum site-determining protein MinD [Anaerovoracaceae bacterium]